jgi:hypothetical protein
MHLTYFLTPGYGLQHNNHLLSVLWTFYAIHFFILGKNPITIIDINTMITASIVGGHLKDQKISTVGSKQPNKMAA